MRPTRTMLSGQTWETTFHQRQKHSTRLRGMQIDPVYPHLFISNIYSGEDQNFKTLVLNPHLISRRLFVERCSIQHTDATLIASSASIFVFFTMLITRPAALRLLITVQSWAPRFVHRINYQLLHVGDQFILNSMKQQIVPHLSEESDNQRQKVDTYTILRSVFSNEEDDVRNV